MFVQSVGWDGGYQAQRQVPAPPESQTPLKPATDAACWPLSFPGNCIPVWSPGQFRPCSLHASFAIYGSASYSVEAEWQLC